VTTTCLVHDDRPQATRRLELLMRTVAEVDEVVAAHDVDDLLVRLGEGPDAMVVVGLTEQEPTGVETVRRVLAAAPGAAVLVAGPVDGGTVVRDALAVGAAGFLRWDAPRAMIRTVVRTVAASAAGDDLLPRAAPAPSAAPASDLREVVVDLPTQRRLDLSVREVQVLIGVGRGLTNADIGRRLYVSDHTVKTHLARLFRKLGAADRAQAVSHAWRLGLFV
jgi:two-component system nitrate/nitrite response regulator NarL